MKTSARDFFLQLGTMVALYVGTVALLNLLFRVINLAFPQVGDHYYRFDGAISLPVATLIVVFPLFLLLAGILHRGYQANPARKEFAVRKWLIWITLFIAGAVVAGDLITLIYYFLDGRELTTGFLLKVLAVLVVTGGIFGYYLSDLRNRLTRSSRYGWRIFAAVLVIGSIVAGFAVIGSPRTQRLLRYDNQKVNDLQNIQWQIVNHYQQKRALPEDLSSLRDEIGGYVVPKDSQTSQPYEYRPIDRLKFELCADFNRSSAQGSSNEIYPAYPRPIGVGPENETWQHQAGRACFSRIIDPDRFTPVTNTKPTV
ncbi:MAG: hypothetical protein HYT48_02300 [Candidatus Vogelbacteria bacterium]|nr:hypothetical protein [Candidatus Vogelbacteria bacterium]